MPRKRKSLGDRIRAEIKRRGWTNRYVSEQTGLTEPMLSRFMRGETDPSLESTEKILDLLGWTVGPAHTKEGR